MFVCVLSCVSIMLIVFAVICFGRCAVLRLVAPIPDSVFVVPVQYHCVYVFCVCSFVVVFCVFVD